MISALCLSLLITTGADPRVFQLEPGESVWDVAAHDFDGDGQQDILTLCCDEKSDPLDKHCALFLAQPGGRFQKTPTVRLALAPDIGAIFLAEMNGPAPKEIVAASADGAQIYTFRDGQLEEIAAPRFTSLFPSAAPEPGILEGHAEDLDGDGIDEWIVPVPTGYEVRTPFSVLKRIRCDVNSAIRTGSGMQITNRLPAFHAFALPDSKQKALAFLSEEVADFGQGSDSGDSAPGHDGDVVG